MIIDRALACVQRRKPAQPFWVERALRHFQYIRGKALTGSGQRQIFRAALAPHLVGLDFEVDLLAFGEAGKARALDGADVYEHIVAAVVRLDKPEAFLAVEPLHSTCRHFLLQSAEAHAA